MADKYYTVAGATSKDASDWANAGSVTELDAYLTSTAAAGDNIFVEGGGTYTFGFFSSQDGVAGDPIKVIGVASGTSAEPPTQSDWAVGADKPIFAGGATGFAGDDYWHWHNIEVTGTSVTACRSDAWMVAINCKVTNSSGTGGRAAFLQGSFGEARFVDCEGISTNGNAFITVGGTLYNCYAHDSSVGYTQTGTASIRIYFSTFDTMSVGIDLNDVNNALIIHNALYNCVRGIGSTTSHSNIIMNNSFTGDTNGWFGDNSGTITGGNNFYSNNWNGNNKDMTWDAASSEDNSAKGANATANAPGYTNAAGGDFTLTDSSAMLGAGKPLDVGVG